MLAQFPGKCGHGLEKSLKHEMVFWFQDNLNAMEELEGTPRRVRQTLGLYILS